MPIEWGGRHRYLLLEDREINLLLPESHQVIVRIQERVPIATFEDGIHGPEVAHHLHWAGLPSDWIYQWAMVVLRLHYRGKQTVLILRSMWYDEVTPSVFSALLGIGVTELQGCSAHAMVQVYPRGAVVTVEVIGFSAFDVCHWIHQTIGRVHWDGHNTVEIIHKEAISASLAGMTPSLKGIACHMEVDIYVLDEVIDLVGAVEVAINSANHKSHINVDNPLVLAVCLEHE